MLAQNLTGDVNLRLYMRSGKGGGYAQKVITIHLLIATPTPTSTPTETPTSPPPDTPTPTYTPTATETPVPTP